MKIMILMDRTTVSSEQIDLAIRQSGFQITVVVGTCQQGIRWAHANGVKFKTFHNISNQSNVTDGPIRSIQALDYADGLVVLWDGTSPGISRMIERAIRQSKPIHMHGLV